jgi:hypothetical protein
MAEISSTPPGPQAQVSVTQTPDGPHVVLTPGPPSAVARLLNVFPHSEADAGYEPEAS